MKPLITFKQILSWAERFGAQSSYIRKSLKPYGIWRLQHLGAKHSF